MKKIKQLPPRWSFPFINSVIFHEKLMKSDIDLSLAYPAVFLLVFQLFLSFASWTLAHLDRNPKKELQGELLLEGPSCGFVFYPIADPWDWYMYLHLQEELANHGGEYIVRPMDPKGIKSNTYEISYVLSFFFARQSPWQIFGSSCLIPLAWAPVHVSHWKLNRTS